MKGQSVKACEPFSKANLMAGESQYYSCKIESAYLSENFPKLLT